MTDDPGLVDALATRIGQVSGLVRVPADFAKLPPEAQQGCRELARIYLTAIDEYRNA